MTISPYRYVMGLLCSILMTNVSLAQWAGDGPRWTYNGQETMFVGPLQSGGQGFSFAYNWGPLAPTPGSIEMWPRTFFKAGYVAVQNVISSSDQRIVVELGSARNPPDGAGGGVIQTRNRVGEINTYLGTVSYEANSGYSGALLIFNNQDDPYAIAGIRGDTGEMWTMGTKPFIVPHPNDENLMIRYIALEGPEAAIYTRGTIDLVSGNAYVSLPEHFAVMANPSSITVSLTPRAAESKGVAAVEVSEQGFRIVELFQGAGNYAVDYLVHGLRSGYEDHEVYLSRTRASQSLSFTPQGTAPTESFEDYLPTEAAH